MRDSSNAGASPPAQAESETADTHDEASSIAGETIEQVGDAGIESAVGETSRPKAERSSGRSAFLVGAGILISRLVGLVRQRVFAHYFGTSAAGDAFSAAFRIPNLLQNVFGEGALSASFIPVYSKLLAQDNEEEAAHVASSILALLALVTSTIVLMGVLFTPYFIDVIAWGFKG